MLKDDKLTIFYFLCVPKGFAGDEREAYRKCDIWGVLARTEDEAIKRLKSQVHWIDWYEAKEDPYFYRLVEKPQEDDIRGVLF